MTELKHARIAVLMGGPSTEAAVSRSSAAGVASALEGQCAAIETMELDLTCPRALTAFNPDVVVPALHGPPGEDGTVQGFLALLGIPYVGSDVHASALAMDKALAKHVFRAAGLPLAPQQILHRGDEIDAAGMLDALGPRVVIKPTRQGSALGVNFADSQAQLRAALAQGLEGDATLLIESRIDGRELTVGVLEETDTAGNTRYLAHPVIEILTPENTWYDYEHRYTAGQSEHLVPAPLDPALAETLRDLAIQAHRLLGCRDLSRADFILSEQGEPVLLEVNTLPGMTPTSLYPDGARALGLAFPELLARLVQRALDRGPDLRLS